MSGQGTFHGIRCECRLYRADGAVRAVAGVFDAPRPIRAVRRIRMAVRTLVSTLDEESAEPIHEWLLLGEKPVIRALSRSEPRTYSFRYESSRVEFTAHRVLYLVPASRAGLPACPQLSSPPPALAAVTGRGIEVVRPAWQRDALRGAGVCRISDEGEFRG